jgi:VanZ family protein
LNHSTKEMLKVWAAALLWLGLIAAESSTLGSSSNTSRILYPLLHYLFGLDLVHFEVWHTVIRKSGHVLGYFMLSLLLFRAWRETLPPRGFPVWSLHWAWVAWLMTTVVASLDEWHQAYIPTRGSSVHDVALDSAAALAAQIVIWLWLRRKSQRDEFKRSAASA